MMYAEGLLIRNINISTKPKIRLLGTCKSSKFVKDVNIEMHGQTNDMLQKRVKSIYSYSLSLFGVQVLFIVKIDLHLRYNVRHLHFRFGRRFWIGNE